ncbi:GatB/YqeY domain-containing protein [Fervidibacillus albus]|uniref:GatB/YqeY domain-containing protein n=1 Tax=Fervidibacillus albus TaxID=2980026 RepID=A0A9E8LVC1_9BACI|nr:GatB/YqeY domain-containing protein [Fervidibacillus albus]WAA10373.1 GatB/YqeY domain-containing protein [Fervidibacillus albus]
MSLLDRLSGDMKEAMKNKEKERLSVIRMIKASLQNEAIKLGKKQLTDDEELTVLSREVKQRKDSLHEFEKAGRTDLIEKTKKELTYINAYLPEQLSEDELKSIIEQTMADIGASSKADIGKVMAAVMPKVKGKADGATVNRLVQRLLS